MKRIRPLLCALLMVAPVLGQVSGSTGTTNGSSGNDLLDELWFMQDAYPIETGRWDLRLTFGWVTESFPANLGDSDDDFVIQPSLVWGACENVQVTVSVPVWLGDGGDVGALEDGNGDAFVNVLWKFADQVDTTPAMALSASVRIPTGENSEGLDGELRLILTNEYDGDLRAHLNVFVYSANGDNDPHTRNFQLGNTRHFQWGDTRHFQFGAVIGMDGPLCADGAVRWVFDYMHRSSEHFGVSNMNVVELGWEWAMADAEKFGMSLQIGTHHSGDNPNLGARITYSRALTY